MKEHLHCSSSLQKTEFPITCPCCHSTQIDQVESLDNKATVQCQDCKSSGLLSIWMQRSPLPQSLRNLMLDLAFSRGQSTGTVTINLTPEQALALQQTLTELDPEYAVRCHMVTLGELEAA